MRMDNASFNDLCRLGNMDEIKKQVENGFDINYLYNDWTPLMIASYRLNFELCEYLLSKGADVNIVDENGDTPFMCLLYNLSPKNEECDDWLFFKNMMTKLIHAGANLELVNNEEISFLGYCAECLLFKSFEFLLSNGANINSMFTKRMKYNEHFYKNETFYKYVEKRIHILTPENMILWKSFRLKRLFN